MNGVFWLVIVMEIIWCAILKISPEAYNSVPLFYLGGFVGGIGVLPICLSAASICSIAGLTLYKANSTKQVILLSPQQMFLSLIAIGAMLSSFHGTYADGVIREKLFILADQLPIIGIFVLHSIGFIRKFAPINGN